MIGDRNERKRKTKNLSAAGPDDGHLGDTAALHQMAGDGLVSGYHYGDAIFSHWDGTDPACGAPWGALAAHEGMPLAASVDGTDGNRAQ